MLNKYKIIGTEGLYIDSELAITAKDVHSYYKLLEDGMIEIEINSTRCILKLHNLRYISSRRMFLDHPDIMKNLNKFEFVSRVENRLGEEIIIVTCVLSTPITILIKNIKFRVVSEYPRYAVSNSGVFIDLLENKFVNVSKKIENSYPTIRIQSSTTDLVTSRVVHRFVALAWCHNDDPVNKHMVNHIDGDKTNYHPTNLEWVTTKSNNIHAVESGLRLDLAPVKIKNIETLEVREFPSMTRAVEYIGRSRLNLTHINPITSKRIIEGTSGKFEVKYRDDNSDWLIDTNPRDLLTSTQVVRLIVNVNGKRVICNNTDHIQELVGDRYRVNPNSFIKACQKFIKFETELPAKIEYLEENRHNTYLYRNSETDKVFSATDRKEIMEATGGSKSTVQKSISTNGAYAINSIWYAKFDDGKEFAVPAVVANKPIPVKVVNNSNEVIYSSVREAAIALNVDKRTITRALESNKPINGHTLTYAH